MSEFLRALHDPNVVFLRYAFAAAVLASVAFGTMGTYVVVRRITYVAGSISHSVLGGIGLALYLQSKLGLAWCHPMLGAVVAALLAALLIGMVSLYAREREDSVIGAIWAIGMAVGLLFIARTPGYVDANSYLFGNILLITRTDLWIVCVLDLLVLLPAVLLYRQLLAVSFDEEFASTRGIKVEGYYLLMLGMTAVTVVLLIRVVGIVMVIALLTLPSAIAGQFARSVWQMIALSIAICMVVTAVGLAVSFAYDLPSGPTIIVIAGAAYLAAAAAGRLRRRRRAGG
jgi:zinc transport system permease protein